MDDDRCTHPDPYRWCPVAWLPKGDLCGKNYSDICRVKCKTCRCWIPPGSSCACCAGRFVELDDDEMAF